MLVRLRTGSTNSMYTLPQLNRGPLGLRNKEYDNCQYNPSGEDSITLGGQSSKGEGVT
jgi:hypothetical protein